MIDPVNNGYQAYNKIDTKIDTQTGRTLQNGEKFSLDYNKENEDKAEQSGQTKEGGVVLELSGQAGERRGTYTGGQSAGRAEKKEEGFSFAKAVASARKLFGNVTRRISEVMQMVKGVLLDFWNSDSPEVIVEDAESTELSENGALEDGGSTELAKLPENGEWKGLAETVYVKNSDLLTYYDRRGQMVKLSGSDRNRILRGDRNSLEG